MKAEKKPFVVEFKKKRDASGKKKSIWGAMDIEAIAGQDSMNETGLSQNAARAAQGLFRRREKM